MACRLSVYQRNACGISDFQRNVNAFIDIRRVTNLPTQPIPSQRSVSMCECTISLVLRHLARWVIQDLSASRGFLCISFVKLVLLRHDPMMKVRYSFIRKVQSALNTATRSLTSTQRRDHITSVLRGTVVERRSSPVLRSTCS